MQSGMSHLKFHDDQQRSNVLERSARKATVSYTDTANTANRSA